jgi:hypothetical protein
MSMRRFSVVEGDDRQGRIVGEGVAFTGGPTSPAVVLSEGAPTPVTYSDVAHVGASHPHAQVVFIDPESSAG